MIDLLTSLLLISIVLFSLLIYQINMLKIAHENQYKTLATIQLMNFSELLLTSQDEKKRAALFSAWNTYIVHHLPDGQGEWDEAIDHQCRVTVMWFDHMQKSLSTVVMC